MRLRFGAAWYLAVMLLSCLAPSPAVGQHSTPIKKKGLIDALGIGGLSAMELAEVIKERGVDSRLTYGCSFITFYFYVLSLECPQTLSPSI